MQNVINPAIFKYDSHPALTELRGPDEKPTLSGFYQVIPLRDAQLGPDQRRLFAAHWNGKRWSNTIYPQALRDIDDLGEWLMSGRRYNPEQRYLWRGVTSEDTVWTRHSLFDAVFVAAGIAAAEAVRRSGHPSGFGDFPRLD